LGLLLAPAVVALARSKALAAGWLVALLHLWLGVVRLGQALAADRRAGPNPGLYLRFAAYLPVSWLATAKGLIDAARPGRRWKW
jgi:hypothetical protein